MRTKRLFLSLTLLLAAGVAFTFLTSLTNNADVILKSKNSIQNFLKNHSIINDFFLEGDAPKDGNGKVRANKESNVKKTPAAQMSWVEMGPSNIGGRTRSVLVDKNNSNIVFAGSVGGGIWKSTTGGLSWDKITGSDALDNIIVSSICQASNGDIYVGTGEYYGSYKGLGYRGQGIWKSVNAGDTWTQLTSTWNNADDSKNIFYYVSKIAIHPTNSSKIYAATAKGLRVSIDAGSTWSNPITDTYADSVCTDVQVSKDGLVVTAALDCNAYVCNTGNDVFVNVSGALVTQIPTDVKRIEFAIAPSNSDYVYCLAAANDGGLKNVYKSADKGNTFTKMIPVLSSQFTPFGIVVNSTTIIKRGLYNNVISVFPDDPEHLLLGGYDLYEYTPAASWHGVSSSLNSFSTSYIHAGIHTIKFVSNYSASNKIIYVGTDGGVFRSTDGAATWTQMNKNYNTAIFNSVSFSNDIAVIGGTQNNGTQLITSTGTNITDSYKIFAGDGGYCEFSMLNPRFIFATSSYGKLGRSIDYGVSFDSADDNIFSKNVRGTPDTIATSLQSFVTPIRLWESFYDTNSLQIIIFKAPRVYHLGDTASIRTPCERYIEHIVTLADLKGNPNDSIEKSDTILVKDTYQSVLAMGISSKAGVVVGGAIWITREGLDFSKVPPVWYRISKLTTVKEIQKIEFSKDGDHLYFSDYNSATGVSKIYRCSNLLISRDSTTCSFNSTQQIITTTEIGNFDRKITSIAVDPRNAENIAVTLGGYNSTDYIYYSSNAATTTSSVTTDNFTSRQGSLSPMPVYSAIINWNSMATIIGTESGVYSTDDISAATPTWEKQAGMPNVPVVQLRQQFKENGWLVAPVVNNGFNTGIKNHGFIYAATAGRGIFRCEDFRGPVSVPEIVGNKANSLNIVVFPNPTKEIASISFNLNKRSDVVISIYDLSGNVVKTIPYKNQDAGNHSVSININDLSAGTYIAAMESNGVKNTAKFVIY
jgi:hypothetical protein